jgi:ABC-type sugar transport system permease subunit
VTKTICSACNAELEAESKFCPDCGTPNASPKVPPAPVAVTAAENVAKPAQNNSQLSVLGYVLTMLALSLPIIGIILAFVWAFGAKTNLARKNFCRAVLILSGMFLLITIVGVVANYSALAELIGLLL